MVDARRGRGAAALVKVILLGDAGVGKTTLICKYTGKPINEKASVGAEIFNKMTDVDGKQVNFNFWDTAGQEKFNSLGVAFFRGCNACVLVYDVTNRKSFDALAKWKREFLEHAAPRDAENFPIFVVGNKSDLSNERMVGVEDAESWARANTKMGYFETSGLNGTGLDALFAQVGQKSFATMKEDDGGSDLPTSLSGAAGAIKLDPEKEKDI